MAIAIAQHFDTEIISADSRQFYKEMLIGTAVPTKEELDSVPHHFIQHKSIFKEYTVGDFEKEALDLLENLFQQNNVVVMVGGSGLYVDAVTKGLDEFPAIDPTIRIGLNKTYREDGIVALQDQLTVLDKVYCSKVDMENPHRLIRALEVCIGTEKPYSSFLKKKNIKRPFNTITVGINAERNIIYDRINNRADLMISKGLLDEAKSLYNHKSLNALQTVGYKELFNYFEGKCTLDHAISEIKKNTRRFAKRQLTWFKKNTNTLWVAHDDDVVGIIDSIENKLTSIPNE